MALIGWEPWPQLGTGTAVRAGDSVAIRGVSEGDVRSKDNGQAFLTLFTIALRLERGNRCTVFEADKCDSLS